MKPVLLVALVLFVFLAACAAPVPTPIPATAAPTVNVAAVQTQAAVAIFATETASAPTATFTPPATNTATATHTATLTQTPTETQPPTRTPTVTQTPLPSPTFTATRVPATRVPPTKVPTIAPLAKNEFANLGGKWDIAYVGEFRDKTVFFYDTGRTAFGVYVTIELRVRNLQTGTDDLANNYTFVAIDQDGNPYTETFDASQNARWQYCGCSVIVSDVAPGGETVVVVTFDVPEPTHTLTVLPRDGFYGKALPGPRFVIENVDQIPAFQHK